MTAPVIQQQKILASAINRLKVLEILECFDPANAASRPTIDQQCVIDDFSHIQHQYVTGGNQSGKSQLGARLVSWLLEENHPTWNRPAEWGAEPLLLLVLGRTSKIIEEVLWRKIALFLDLSRYKIQRIGGVIQKVTNTSNGNTLVFLSHHADTEAREKVQAFVAHFAWLDEMASFKLIEELHRRIQARRGYFLATFTPKVINNEVRRLVDAASLPYSKKYKLRAFDNPVYSEEDKIQILASLSTASDTYKNTVLEGDWCAGEEMVYFFDHEKHIEAPVGYDKSWRHVESIDPALKSKLGFTIWAENPQTNVWYCVRAEYISGIFNPTDLLAAVQSRTAGFNIVRRIADTHESWWFGTAAAAGIKPAYLGPVDKNSRKGMLIKNLQETLGKKVKIAPWCDDLLQEFQECRWAEAGETKIVNASSYHLLDAAQYFVDLMPRPDPTTQTLPWQEWLYRQNESRKEKIREKKTTTAGHRPGRISTRRGGGRFRWRGAASEQ